MITPADALRPVHALRRALARLEELAREGEAGDPRRGPLRQRAWNLARLLPPGSLEEAEAEALQARFREVGDTELPLPSRAFRRPEPLLGATYWLSSHDHLGAVIRLGLLSREEGDRPFASFWPAVEIDEVARDTAGEAYAQAARALGAPPLEPLRGWHRLVCLDPGLDALERVEGSSMGAALLLMLLSCWSERPLPQDIAVTGHLDAQGRLRLGGNRERSVAAKREALRRERPCVERLVVPAGLGPEAFAGEGPELVPVETLAELLSLFGLEDAAAPRPPSVSSWLDAAHEAAWLDRTRSVPPPVLLGRLEALQDAYGHLVAAAGWAEEPPWALVQAHTETQVLLCRYRAYAGDRKGAMEAATHLQWLLEEEGGANRPKHAVTARLLNALASLLIELGRGEEAWRYADAALGAARQAGDALEAARILSTRGRIAAHTGDDDAALLHLADALAAFEEAAPWEANISHCYTLAALARLGRHEEARAALERAEAANDGASGMSEGWQGSNALYLAHERLRLALLSGEDLAPALERAERLLDARARGPWPAAVIHSRIVEAALRLGELERAAAALEALSGLREAHPVPVVILHQGRAAAATLRHRLEEGLAVDPLLEELAELWVRDRAERGPPAPEGPAAALLAAVPEAEDAAFLAELPLAPGEKAAGLAALLATDVY
ncbi:MAG: tetratricopeptide repeat protein [Deltaproteobacteria bacterium]|nr:tetratricopeptide repeat protein [Deltaproteobacteria bacterium]